MNRIAGVIAAGTVIVFGGLIDRSAVAASISSVTGPGLCVDSADATVKMYRDGYSAMVSNPDTSAARNRANLGLPTLAATQVLIVADSSACHAASLAYDNELEISEPTFPVMVLQLGTMRIVIKDIGGFQGPPMNVLFNHDFTQVIRRIWY